MRRGNRVCTAIFLATLLAAGPALAMDTDDPGTVAPKAVEIEVSGEYSSFSDGNESVLSLTATTGILENLDIGVSVPWLSLDPDEGGGESGIGDLEVGAKFRFLEAQGSRPALALTAGLTVPTGDEDKGLGSGEVDISAALVAGFDFAPVNLYLNLGYGRVNSADEDLGENKEVYFASAALEWAVAEPLALNAELLWESAGADGDDAPLQATAGAEYALSDTLCLDGGARVGLSETAPDWGIFATLTITLGGK